MFETLEQVAALPDAIGGHACECGHPEMRRLPDGVFHCVACGSEVLPIRYCLTAQNPEAGCGQLAQLDGCSVETQDATRTHTPAR